MDGPRVAGRPATARCASGTPCARTYLDLGHRVDVLDPAARACPTWSTRPTARPCWTGPCSAPGSATASARAEAAAHRAWFRGGRLPAGGRRRAFVNEGEGDLLVAGRPGTRCCWPAPASAPTRARTPRPAAVLGRPVLPLELVDPRYYHLDTALAVLDGDTIAWLPEAFSPASRARAAPPGSRTRSSPTPADAAVLGLNAVSDGRHVVLPAQAPRLAAALAERGFEPIPVDLSELLKGGGGVKCCTLEVRGMTLISETATDVARAAGRRALRAQLPPAAGGGRARRGRLGHRRRGPALPGLPRRVLRAELRPRPPGPARRRAPPAGPGHADQPGVRQRPARPVLRGAGRRCSASSWCCR